MSMNLFRAAIAAAGIAFLAHPALAQNPKDLLDRAKGEQSILVQKLEDEMRRALEDAKRLQGVSKPRAVPTIRTSAPW